MIFQGKNLSKTQHNWHEPYFNSNTVLLGIKNKQNEFKFYKVTAELQYLVLYVTQFVNFTLNMHNLVLPIPTEVDFNYMYIITLTDFIQSGLALHASNFVTTIT